MTVESVSGSWVELATSQLTADWNGQVVLRVGSGLVSLTPGRQIVSVTAAAASEWTLTFQSSGGTPTPTPRSTAPAAPPPQFAASSTFTRARVAGRTVRLVRPPGERDRGYYGRLLREVWVTYQGHEVNIGDELLAAGLAMPYVPGGPDCLA